jgi:hypothetical protein
MKYITTFFLFFVLPIFSLKIDKPKLCVNCKYFVKYGTNHIYGKCSLFPKINNNYLVTGNEEDKSEHYTYCSIARSNDDMCGKEGMKYKKKYEKKYENL